MKLSTFYLQLTDNVSKLWVLVARDDNTICYVYHPLYHVHRDSYTAYSNLVLPLVLVIS